MPLLTLFLVMAGITACSVLCFLMAVSLGLSFKEAALIYVSLSALLMWHTSSHFKLL